MALDHPLRFERIFLEKVWGGRALETSLGIALPPGKRVGETWEVVDREAERSLVAEGPHAGRTLGELVVEHGRELLGETAPSAKGRFPLLVKYIDARENLSIQVHPDEEAAARIGGSAEGKTEAWYVLAAEPGAVVWCGLRAGVTREAFAAHATEAGCEAMLAEWEVRPGDCVTVPGGTIHSIGAGVTLLEVQQNSDTTYRLHDWGRVGLDGKPRETHVERALDVVRFGERPLAPVRGSALEPEGPPEAGLRRTVLSETDGFALERLEVSGRTRLSTDGRFAVYCVAAGSGTLECGAGSFELGRGDTWLLPAALGEHGLHEGDGPLTVVRLTGGPR